MSLSALIGDFSDDRALALLILKLGSEVRDICRYLALPKERDSFFKGDRMVVQNTVILLEKSENPAWGYAQEVFEKEELFFIHFPLYSMSKLAYVLENHRRIIETLKILKVRKLMLGPISDNLDCCVSLKKAAPAIQTFTFDYKNGATIATVSICTAIPGQEEKSLERWAAWDFINFDPDRVINEDTMVSALAILEQARPGFMDDWSELPNLEEQKQ